MMSSQLERDGFAVVPRVLGAPEVLEVGRMIEEQLPDRGVAGVRDLAAKVPRVRELAESRMVRGMVELVLGSDARLVRSVLFRKSEAVNWQVAWHQDVVIAVQRREEVEGFACWSSKDGVPHVQPPVAVLERMVSVRLHLDAADEANGALWVSPGSHRLGRLPVQEAATAAGRHGKHVCAVAAGDALVFRPLVLHASRKATCDRPRRVIHLEFAGVSLPESLGWAEGTV